MFRCRVGAKGPGMGHREEHGDSIGVSEPWSGMGYVESSGTASKNPDHNLVSTNQLSILWLLLSWLVETLSWSGFLHPGPEFMATCCNCLICSLLHRFLICQVWDLCDTFYQSRISSCKNPCQPGQTDWKHVCFTSGRWNILSVRRQSLSFSPSLAHSLVCSSSGFHPVLPERHVDANQYSNSGVCSWRPCDEISWPRVSLITSFRETVALRSEYGRVWAKKWILSMDAVVQMGSCYTHS